MDKIIFGDERYLTNEFNVVEDDCIAISDQEDNIYIDKLDIDNLIKALELAKEEWC